MKKLQLPGSKSITNRTLILAALGNQPMELHGLLDSDDARYMQAALVEFGVVFEHLGKNAVRVVPPAKLVFSPHLGPLPVGEDDYENSIFIGNAGTAARFLSALSLVAEESFTLTGIDRMKQRPQADLQQALVDLGVEITSLENAGFLPTQFASDHPTIGSTVNLSGKVSSQFLTALLLVAPKLENGLTINIDGAVPSWPYIEMTLALLKIWGVTFTVTDQKQIIVEPGLNAPEKYQIPSDMSGASYPIAWSLLSGTPIEITNFGAKTLQGDEGFLEIAQQAGANVTRDGDKCQIIPGSELKNIGDVDWSAMPDVSMTGMILAAVAPGTSKFTGLESLRVKECDRIRAMEQLKMLGVEVEISGDVVEITGNPHPGPLPVGEGELIIDSFDDHRIAMCFGVLRATQALDFEISDPHCVAKTWPEFWVELADWQGQLRPVSAVILVKPSPDSPESGLKYLIVKKPRKENAWQFPQGGVDPGETGLQAAKRELNEECGADLVVKFKGEKPVGEYKYLFPTGFSRHDKNIIGAKVAFFRTEYLSGPVEIDQEEIVDHEWVLASQLDEYFDQPYLDVVREWV